MSLDLNTILKDWPHQNGSIKVRKIVGLDGREKLQLRIDLGGLQMELRGRPHGVRPHRGASPSDLNGSIKVRKIGGLDGREKLQLRIDLGVLQMELHGRPDGVRPYGCESL